MTDSFETISSEEPGWVGSVAPEPRRSSAGARATALSAALTLVLAGGVATAAYRSSNNGTDPATLIPANAFAVASVDLGLSGGQDDALEQLLDRFPGSPTRSGSGSVRDRLLRALFHSGDSSVDYDADVKPWLGDHAAIAGWTDNGSPQMEVLLQSTDDDAARTHLTKLFNGDGAVVMSHGYAVVGETEAKAKAAVDAAEQSSLADSDNYSADVGGLPDDEILTAWIDGPAVAHLMSRAFMSAPGGAGGMLPGLGMLGMGSLQNTLGGRFALGVRAASDYAQLDLRQIGGQQAGTARSTLLTDLPAGTVGALELGDPGRVVDGLMGMVQFFGGFASSSEGGCATAVPMPPAPATGGTVRPMMPKPRLVIPPGTPHRKARLREFRHAQRQALRNLRLARKKAKNGTTYAPDLSYPGRGCPPPPPVNPLDQLKKATGLTLPNDAKTLLGDGGVVAYGGLRIGGLPDVAIRSHPTDLSAAQAVADTLRSHLAADPGMNLAVQTVGSDLVLATSDTYAGEVVKDGALGDQDRVQTALGEVPAEVTVAGYVDFTRIWPLLGDHVPDGVTHLKALGFWGERSGDVTHVQLRIVAG